MVANIMPADPPPPNPGGQKVKIQLFQNMVILHIKLKAIVNAVTWKQIFCPQSPLSLTLGSKGQIKLLQNMVMLHIKLKGIVNAPIW